MSGLAVVTIITTPKTNDNNKGMINNTNTYSNNNSHSGHKHWPKDVFTSARTQAAACSCGHRIFWFFFKKCLMHVRYTESVKHDINTHNHNNKQSITGEETSHTMAWSATFTEGVAWGVLESTAHDTWREIEYKNAIATYVTCRMYHNIYTIHAVFTFG